MTDPTEPAIRIEHALHATDWPTLAEVMARAPLKVRDPPDLARAAAASYANAYAFAGDVLVGGARAVSDGVFYATIYDVVVDPAWQGNGVGRRLVRDLLDRLPVDKVFLTSVPGKEGFYAKLGFLRQTNAMGWYTAEARADAVALGVLVAAGADGGLASPGPGAISNGYDDEEERRRTP
jgi:GNAT superfamily N-acetyltransferase